MLPEDMSAKVNHELATAESARASGNEAKARVCSRRAAGIAIQEFYKALDEPFADNNVITALHKLQNDARVNPGWRSFADLLLLRVTEDHTLPVKADILAETRSFIHEVEIYLKGKLLER